MDTWCRFSKKKKKKTQSPESVNQYIRSIDYSIVYAVEKHGTCTVIDSTIVASSHYLIIYSTITIKAKLNSAQTLP